MSDQENVKPDEETEVEAHKKPVRLENDSEPRDDSSDDDDVELHKKPAKL